MQDECLRQTFSRMYKNYYSKDICDNSTYLKPYFHLGSSDFYHLVWREGVKPPMFSKSPSAKYLRENLLYAKLDDELWDLLQDAESRDYLKRSIIKRYLTK
jgi:predicted restriction endonuclease